MKLELHGACARHPAARADSEPALRNLDLRIAAGEQLAVIGPSGAGKTTLLQLLACAQPPSAGQILLDDVNPSALSRRDLQRLRGHLILVPQQPPLPPRQRVVTAVLAGRLPAMSLLESLRSLLHPSDLPAAQAALERFDLADKLFERVDRLSGGERQRVGLARALLAPASLWLVDEPLSALDPARSRQALATLQDLARSRQVTLVATLHQVELALQHFPRIIGLRGGRLAFDLPASEVTPERLAQLYAQHEQELLEPAPVPQETPATTRVAVPRC
ncbi:phosphonate ABC transporter ATP-binding protein [Malikia sp.]|uniref:phosphonate ABC transporter ATP-binding protein n=1 Tax=Malikia sp. TaxID=2070706 RepID=UPI0026036B3F|nr:ATP-binding cassette domain-containing protein [Malikia sp.]MDD2728634.1 ATP-binding cassette domain-containing protein [Malikia sp.]